MCSMVLFSQSSSANASVEVSPGQWSVQQEYQYQPVSPQSCIVGTFTATDVPKTICDLCTVTSVLSIHYDGSLNSLSVTDLSINHPKIGDLEVSLTSPNGTTVILIDNVCGNSANIPGIRLGSGPQIGSVCPPQQGSTYSPSFPLTPFINAPIIGLWTLTIRDQVAGGSGTLTSWGLFTVSSCPPTPTPTVPATATPCTSNVYSDVPPGSTFYFFITCLSTRGMVSGYSDCTFRPNVQVTRGQLAKIVSNAAGYAESPDPQIFEDVPSANTFYQWINRLARRGHMSGYACGGVGEPCTTGMPYFRPFANATRGQTSKIVSNAAGYTEIPTDQTFEDVSPTHTFYREIQRLASRNIMQGYPCGGVGEPCVSGKPYFRPANNVTRGQSAKIVANTFYPNCDTS